MKLQEYFDKLDAMSAEIRAIRDAAAEIREAMSCAFGPWIIVKVCLVDINDPASTFTKGFTYSYNGNKGQYCGFYNDRAGATRYQSPRVAAEIMDSLILKPYPAKGEPRCPHTRYGNRDNRWVYRVVSTKDDSVFVEM